ncbi:hypothetical protein NKI39_02835 [Mesorhizobium sp. M0664]|uniref:hypothetical protein n=1 Tax=Mesorhizobium sp. M0664 TaxID=2956982 RepID=UPI00333B7D3B
MITKTAGRAVLLAYEVFVRLLKRDRRVELIAELSKDDIPAVEASAWSRVSTISRRAL